MLITKPAYYDEFHCIADRCPDSCCQEWTIQVDPDSAARYACLPGPLGDRLRQVLREENGLTLLTIENRRCPMWRDDGLCRIQLELGEEALCHTCREFPRLTHDYGDFRELQLELSCPEAARILLSAPYAPPITIEIPGGEEADYDTEAMSVLKDTRKELLAILSDDTRPIGETLAIALLYGCEAQNRLDGGDAAPFDPESALDSARSLAKPGDIRLLTDFFSGLEVLTEAWPALLAGHHSPALSDRCRPLARYLVERYWLQAVSDYDLYCRVKFILISCLLIRCLDCDFVRAAQLWSKEIENNTDNVEAILDAAYASPAFTDDKLLGLLLGA